jgi:cell division septation protein DedD
MSVATSETELFKDKIEVSLDGRQIFYLFFGGAVIATLVFVLGVMVGRRVESRSVAETGSPATDPLAALDRLEGSDDLAFPAALRGDDVLLGSVDATLAGRNRVAKENMATGGPSAPDAAHDKATPAEPTSPGKTATPAAAVAPDAKGKPAKVEKAVVKPEAVAEAEPDLDEEKVIEEPKAKAKRRRFTLQVGSFQDKEEADTFFRGLRGSPYDPYMVEADVPGKGKYFRVRVGGYGSFDEAVAAKTEFEASQHVIAYVTRLK